MDDLPIEVLVSSLIFLIIASGFFSSSETSMMALNRYRLKHLARSGNKTAQRIQKMLEKPEHLIGVILIGNNLVNIIAATIATLIAIHYWGPKGVAIAPIALTVIILIFSEVTPKTLAAYYPEKVAFPASFVLKPLLWLFYPLVVLVNMFSSILLGIFKMEDEVNGDKLSPEELRSVLQEAGGIIPEKHQKMLMNILDLEDITVDDIMIPKNEIIGIDLDEDIDEILLQLKNTQHTRLPVYRGDINNIIGIFHARKSARLLDLEEINKAEFMQLTIEPYFVPEGTSLHNQLIEFQQIKRRVGLVVDEYGELQGIVNLEDILEEIVGEFTTDAGDSSQDIHPKEDGSYIIDGSTTIRDINRALRWHLPTDGAKTLNGLIVDHLETIPETSLTIKIEPYTIEVIQIKENRVKTAKLAELKRGKPQKD